MLKYLVRQASRSSCIVCCVKGAESVRNFIKTSSEVGLDDCGRCIIAQYAGVWPSTESSCNIEESETCCRAQAIAQLSSIPIAAIPPLDHNEMSLLDSGPGLVLATRSRISLRTMLRTSSWLSGVGVGSEGCAVLLSFGKLDEENTLRMVRLIRDVNGALGWRELRLALIFLAVRVGSEKKGRTLFRVAAWSEGAL